MALRTIRNAQGYIEKIRAKATSISESWEDFWDLENPAPEGYEPPEEFQARRAGGYVEPPLEAEEETRTEGAPRVRAAACGLATPLAWLDMAEQNDTRKGWTRDQKIAIGILIATVLGVLVAMRTSGGSKSTGSSTQGSSGGTVQASTSTTAAATSGPVYLSALTPAGGDVPTRGDTRIGDQDFPHSIFYDNIPGNQSNSSACQKVADPTCQATDYNIASARYHQFSAMIGVTGCSGDTASWSLTVDSVVVKSGPVAMNSSAQRISVAIPRGNSLELEASTSSFSGAACGGVNIIWGNAKLS